MGSERTKESRSARSEEDVREYIGAMAAGLAELAYASRLESLAVACDVVREIAEDANGAAARMLRLS
jgi:hypothetical protein